MEKGVAQVTDFARVQTDPQAAVTPLLRPVDDRAPPMSASRLHLTLHRECEAMLQHALDRGEQIPVETAQRLAQALSMSPAAGASEAEQFADLTILHGELSAIVAPARGSTLVLLREERKAYPFLYVFGPVRLVRQMLGFAVFALFSTSVLSTSGLINVANVAKGWFRLDGEQAIFVLGFLLSVACLGAAFSNLSKINRYIEHANYDPTFEGSYWVRIVLGVIAGVVLAEILFDLVMNENTASASALPPAGTRVMLAFLGGFATAPVQRLLSNLSDAIGTLMQGHNAPVPKMQRSAPTPAPAGGQSGHEQRPSRPGS